MIYIFWFLVVSRGFMTHILDGEGKYEEEEEEEAKPASMLHIIMFVVVASQLIFGLVVGKQEERDEKQAHDKKMFGIPR